MQSDHTPDHLLNPTSGPNSASVSGRPGSRTLIYFSWACLVYVIFVIVWGAFVRASGSGAGCGSHWPLCNGQILPSAGSATGAPAASTATWIEFSHRITSGLSLLMVASLFFLVRRGSRLIASGQLRSEQRRAAGWAFGFIVGEAGVGAVLVLQRLVAGDSSAARAIVIALHLANTLFLVAALVWTAMALSFAEAKQDGQPGESGSGLSQTGPDGRTWAAVLFKRLRRIAVLFLVVGASGAIVALGDTLFPAKDLISGLAQDLSASAHFLVRLRVVHPFLAVGTAWALWLVLGVIENHNKNSVLVARVGLYARFFLVAQVMFGILNWLLMAPHWLQLLHLAGSNALWVSVVALLFALNRIAKASPVG